MRKFILFVSIYFILLISFSGCTSSNSSPGSSNPNTNNTLTDALELIRADRLDELGATGQGRTVVIIDTGVETDHLFLDHISFDEHCFSPQFSVSPLGAKSSTMCPNTSIDITNSTRIVEQHGPGTASPERCPENNDIPVEGCNHGTFIAGIIAGQDNSNNFHGIVPDTDIIAIQTATIVNSQDDCTSANRNHYPCVSFVKLSDGSDSTVDALHYVLELHNTGNFNIDAVNISIGNACLDNPMIYAINQLTNNNIAVIQASGNDADPVLLSSPTCNFGTAIPVGSVTLNDTVYNDATWGSNGGTNLAFLAPGVSIYSSSLNQEMVQDTGTSFAAPFVTGAFAAIRSRIPDASIDEIVNALQCTGTEIPDSRTGGTPTRRINVDLALATLLDPAAVSDSETYVLELFTHPDVIRCKAELFGTLELIPIERYGRGANGEVEWSPDGTKLVVASSIGAWVYDSSDFSREPYLIGGNEGLVSLGNTVRSLAFSPDGSKLALVDDLTMRYYDVNTGTELFSFPLTGHTGTTIANIEFSPDGQLIATASWDATVRLWNATSGEFIRSLEGHTRYITALEFSPDSRAIATASDDKTIQIWRLDTGEGRIIFDSFAHTVTFSPDGRQLAIGDGFGLVTTYSYNQEQMQIGDAIQVLEHSGHVWAVEFAPTSNILVSGGGGLHLWDNNALPTILDSEADTFFSDGIAFNPTGTKLAISGMASKVSIWDMPTQRQIAVLDGYGSFSSRGTLLFDSSAGHLAINRGARIDIIDQQTQNQTSLPSSDPFATIEFNSDGVNLIASRYFNNMIAIWDTDSLAPIIEIESSCEDLTDSESSNCPSLNSLDVSSDGSQLLSATSGGIIQLWDYATYSPLETIPAANERIWSAEFNSDGQSFATLLSDQIQIWDMNNLTSPSATLHNIGSVSSLQIKPDWTMIASVVDSRIIRLTDMVTDHTLAELTAEGRGEIYYPGWENVRANVTGLAFHPTKPFLISTHGDRYLRIWNLDTLTLVSTIAPVDNNYVQAIAFSEDGNWLATGSRDGTVRLWEVR